MAYEKLDLIAEVHASQFSCDMSNECCDNEIGTHYEGGTIRIDWDNPKSLPECQKWLLETYGPTVKEHSTFSVVPT